MRRFVPVPPPSKVPDSWEDSDEEQPEERPLPESIVDPEPPKLKPSVQLLKRTETRLDAVERLSRMPALSLIDSAQRQDHYARTRRKIFGSLLDKPAVPTKPQKPPPVRTRVLACDQDPDFIRDPTLYQRRFDPGFGLNDDGRGDTRPERTYESEFPDALPRR